MIEFVGQSIQRVVLAVERVGGIVACTGGALVPVCEFIALLGSLHLALSVGRKRSAVALSASAAPLFGVFPGGFGDGRRNRAGRTTALPGGSSTAVPALVHYAPAGDARQRCPSLSWREHGLRVSGDAGNRRLAANPGREGTT